MKRHLAVGLCAGTLVLAALAAWTPWASRAETAPSSREIERARREVRLLDDIYKSAIVLITKHYVDDKSDLAAGEAFKVLFNSMKEKGWHEVRLLDGTGEPLNEVNKPQDEFERKAIKAMLDGKPYYEELATLDGQRYLRAATPLPVVMDKCILCHENFRGKKIIGGLGYTLPLDTKQELKK